MIFKEVHKGIDSVYLSFLGVVKDEILEELLTKQELARSDDEAKQARATMIIGDHVFEVKDKGKGKYKLVIVDNWFHIQIAGGNSNRIPGVYAQISSELLNCAGLETSIRHLREVVSQILRCINHESLSRVDTFVDFVTDKDFNSLDKDLWVTRAEITADYRENGEATGSVFGRGGKLTARLYNKTIEIRKSNKDFFKEIWTKGGWDGEQTVWRLEFQARRGFLTDIQTPFIKLFVIRLDSIWEYFTEHWLRLTVNDGTENRSRWPLDELWKGIQGVRFPDGSFEGISRSVNTSRLPDDRQLFLNGIGILISYALKNGHTEVWKAADRFMTDAIRFLNEYLKNSTEYMDAEDYINKKMELKRKKFNLRKPE